MRLFLCLPAGGAAVVNLYWLLVGYFCSWLPLCFFFCYIVCYYCVRMDGTCLRTCWSAFVRPVLSYLCIFFFIKLRRKCDCYLTIA